jgi:urease beta subunit
MKLKTLAVPLGWFSIGLGLAELFAPRRIAAAHGRPGARALVQGFGAREIAAGAGILAAPANSAGLWARAAGDVLDIGAAGAAVALAKGKARKVAIGTLAFVAGALVLDVLVARAVAATDDI